MLSNGTIATVKATAPILAEHGEMLTRHFYARMFANNPEVSPLFNPANQHAGGQQRALASAITAYAENIDNLGALQQSVELIAQKHASLQIKPKHYPIVGANLIASIREVLQEGATTEILDAWQEAYSFLANILMGREAEIYAYNAGLPGGWEGLRQFKVTRKIIESTRITSFYLSPCDSEVLPMFKPGQYITLRVSTASGSTTMRNYSLSGRPGEDYFRISVKCEARDQPTNPDGFVSTHLHQSVSVGDIVEVGPPCGDFVLDTAVLPERAIVFLAGGVGITPLMSMASTTLRAGFDRDVVFVHACLDHKVQAFRKDLKELDERYENFRYFSRYSEPVNSKIFDDDTISIGFIEDEYLRSVIKHKNAEYYFCGPKEFMSSVKGLLDQWQIPEDQIHFEFFGPQQGM